MSRAEEASGPGWERPALGDDKVGMGIPWPDRLPSQTEVGPQALRS